MNIRPFFFTHSMQVTLLCLSLSLQVAVPLSEAVSQYVCQAYIFTADFTGSELKPTPSTFESGLVSGSAAASFIDMLNTHNHEFKLDCDSFVHSPEEVLFQLHQWPRFGFQDYGENRFDFETLTLI